MDGSFGLASLARWHVFGVILFVFRPVTWASAASCQGEVANLGDFSIVHGPLHEEVLSPSAVLPTFLALLSGLPPAAVRVGCIHLLQESLEAFSAGNLQVTKKATNQGHLEERLSALL